MHRLGSRVCDLKILFYIHALAGGGAERVWALVASELAQTGNDVMFAVDYRDDANLSLLGPDVRLLEMGPGHLHSMLALRRIIRRERPDVTISALGAGNLKHLLAAMLAGRRDRAILSYHGYIDNEPKRLSQLSFRLTPLLTRLAAHTVVVSEDLRQHVVDDYGADASRVSVILNPVAVPEATVSDRDLAARSPLVLAASRLTPAKNVPFLVRAFARVRTPEARLAILGEGEDRPAIESEIARLGLNGRVSQHGYQRQPWPFYNNAKVFVVGSRIEAFGLTIVEALGCGLPVVSTDCGGPREILDQPALGRLVDQGDEVGFATAIDELLATPGPVAPRLERAAVFSVESRAEAYLALMRTVAKAARSRAG